MGAAVINEILLALVAKTAEVISDAGLTELRDRYNLLARKAAKAAAQQLLEKYGTQFTDIWGSTNFIECLPSLGNPDLTRALLTIKEGDWEVNEAVIADSLAKQLSETMPHLSEYAPELVKTFLENFKALLKAEDPESLTKRIYNKVDATYTKVDETHRSMQQFMAALPTLQSQLQSLSDSQPEIAALRNTLQESQRQTCEANLKQAELLIASSKFDQAKDVLLSNEDTASAVNDSKLLGRLYNALGQTESWQGRRATKEAHEYLHKAATHIPNSSMLRANLAAYYFNSQQFEKAASYLSSIPSEEHSFANFYNIKGLLSVHDEQLEEAQGFFLEAIRLDPGFWEAQGNLGRLFIELGQLDEARKVFVALHTNNPKHISPYIGLGNFFFDRANGSIPESREDQSNLEKARGWYTDGVKTLQVLGAEERYVAEDLGILLGNLGGS